MTTLSFAFGRVGHDRRLSFTSESAVSSNRLKQFRLLASRNLGNSGSSRQFFREML